MSALLSAVLQPFKLARCGLNIVSTVTQNFNLAKPELSLLTQTRSKVRCYFPRPNEVKRVRRHGWATRMSTPNGRKIIMRRVLKGRFVLSH